MTAAAGRWSDLGPRVASAAVLIAVAGFEVWIGGPLFEAFIALICGAMVWELARMLAPERTTGALVLAALTALAVFGDPQVPLTMGLPMLAVPALAGLVLIRADKALFFVFALWIAFAGHGFMAIRAELGVSGVLWLICVVVASDVAGYFAGKAIGGPKFWPRVSPKKTWSGTVAGWIGAGVVGWFYAEIAGFGVGMIPLSVLTAMAGQASSASIAERRGS